MEDTSNKLKDYMISGFFFYGRFRLKRNLTVTCYFTVLIILALTSAHLLPAGLRQFLALPLSFGLILCFIHVPWIFRAARVSRSVRRLKKRGESTDALNDIEEVGKPYYEKREVVFGSHFAFFFQFGVAFSYREVESVKIAVDFGKSRGLRFNILYIRLQDGKWLPLARLILGSGSRNPALIEPLRKYAAEIIKRNPTAKVE